MHVPLSWLRELVAVDAPTSELAEAITMGATNVEGVTRPLGGVRGVVVTEVRDVAKVEGSDKLHLVQVTTDGADTRTIVCGASNYAPGDRVAAALPGAVLPGDFRITAREVFGVTSDGMICSAKELGVGADHRGIWVLDDDAPVGADLVEWLGLDDEVIELEVTPDRGYLLSMVGVARDVAALTGTALTLPSATDLGALDEAGVTLDIADAEQCPRFTAHRIEGVDPTRRTPARLQVRLVLAGMRPISPVVDATNLAMLETGQPTHAYDLATLAGPHLGVRYAVQGETLETLDDVIRELDPDDLVIVDADRVIGLAGVMGGAATEVSPGTSTVILEAAAFSPTAVLRTARRHKLFSEASKRFEKTVPPQLVRDAAARTAALLAELTGGRVTGCSDTAPAPPAPAAIHLDVEHAPGLLGVDLDAPTQAGLLESIGCAVTSGPDTLEVHPPAWRPDLLVPVDLTEELVRLHGMEQVPATLPSTGRVGRRAPEHAARVAVRQALVGGGWMEALTMPFTALDAADALGFDPDDRRRDPVRLVNPLSKEEAALRTTLLTGLLGVIGRNTARQNPDVAVFEVGHVFLRPTPDEPGPDGGPDRVMLPADPLMLGFAICGAADLSRHDHPGRPADIYDVLGAIDLVRAVLGRPSLDVRAADQAPYHPGRCARVSLDGVDLGVVGELHPRAAQRMDVPARTVAGELRLEPLLAGGVSPATAVAPSPLPSLRFDVAVEVDADVPAADVEDAVREGAGPALTSLVLFDVYEGSQLGAGRRSLAYGLRLDDAERQLTDTDAADAIDRIDERVAARVGGRLRR